MLANSFFFRIPLFSLATLHRNTVLALRSKAKVICLNGFQPGFSVTPDVHPEPWCQWENEPSIISMSKSVCSVEEANHVDRTLPETAG